MKTHAKVVIDIQGKDFSYDVSIMDSTHLALRLGGTERWGIPLHFAQLDRGLITQLRALGLVTDNWFVTPGGV